MDKYKKKSLNFMGFSREVRKSVRENQRCVSRHERFSIIRPLDDESIVEEKKENNSKIPFIGKPKDQAKSRTEMLAKWKQDKMIKKQQESKLKKPAFKVSVIKPNPPPSIGSKPLFALNTSSRLLKSSFQVSNSQLSGKKQESLNASNTKISSKVSNPQVSANKPAVDAVNIKNSGKDKKIQSSLSKIVVPDKPESKWKGNKESGMKSKVYSTSKVVNKDQLPSSRKQPTIGFKPPQEKKQESRLQPLNARSKVTSLAKDVKKNTPSGLPKPNAFRTLSKGAEQAPSGLPKPNAIRTLSKGAEQAIPKKNAVKSIPKFSKTGTSQQKADISEKTTKSVSKVSTKPNDDHLTKKPTDVVAFECELSHIEPVKEQRKSFAPPGFMFQPPVELSSSLFLEDGPSAIFMRMKNQFLRTSTPKQSPSNKKSSSETEDSECLEKEDTKCTTNEEEKDTNSIKNTDDKLESSHKYDLEALLSSSLESVCLNDIKPIDCKQSLKFEFPEVVSIQNQEEKLLSSKITHPEHSLATEPTPGGAINPSLVPDSVENDKTEINYTDNSPPDYYEITAHLPEVDNVFSEVVSDPINIVKPTDCKKPIEFEFSEVFSTQDREEVHFSSKITHPEHSLAPEPTPGKVGNPLVMPDSAEIDKTEINSTNISPTSGSKITEPFSEDVLKVMPDPTFIEPNNVEKNQMVSNGFHPKLENSLLKIPGRKIRNLRQSEKPGLASINESLENTPKSALKKEVLDDAFTLRRSLRLARQSGNFSSLENLLDFSKPTVDKDLDEAGLKGVFTPRRSKRLSKFSTEFNSAESLFEIRRPTLYGSPEKDENLSKLSSRLTYDFDRLTSETEEDSRPRFTRGGKVSLLYTPPNKSRPSILRHSIKGDLMSFSPNM